MFNIFKYFQILIVALSVVSCGTEERLDSMDEELAELNQQVEDLRESMDEISENSGGINDGINNISQSFDDAMRIFGWLMESFLRTPGEEDFEYKNFVPSIDMDFPLATPGGLVSQSIDVMLKPYDKDLPNHHVVRDTDPIVLPNGDVYDDPDRTCVRATVDDVKAALLNFSEIAEMDQGIGVITDAPGWILDWLDGEGGRQKVDMIGSEPARDENDSTLMRDAFPNDPNRSGNLVRFVLKPFRVTRSSLFPNFTLFCVTEILGSGTLHQRCLLNSNDPELFGIDDFDMKVEAYLDASCPSERPTRIRYGVGIVHDISEVSAIRANALRGADELPTIGDFNAKDWVDGLFNEETFFSEYYAELWLRWSRRLQ